MRIRCIELLHRCAHDQTVHFVTSHTQSIVAQPCLVRDNVILSYFSYFHIMTTETPTDFRDNLTFPRSVDPQNLLQNDLLPRGQLVMPIHSTRLETDVTLLSAFLHVDDGRGAGVGVPGGDAAGRTEDKVSKRNIESGEGNVSKLTRASRQSGRLVCLIRRSR